MKLKDVMMAFAEYLLAMLVCCGISYILCDARHWGFSFQTVFGLMLVYSSLRYYIACLSLDRRYIAFPGLISILFSLVFFTLCLVIA